MGCSESVSNSQIEFSKTTAGFLVDSFTNKARPRIATLAVNKLMSTKDPGKWLAKAQSVNFENLSRTIPKTRLTLLGN